MAQASDRERETMTKWEVLAAIHRGVLLAPSPLEYLQVRSWLRQYHDILMGYGQDKTAALVLQQIQWIDSQFSVVAQ